MNEDAALFLGALLSGVTAAILWPLILRGPYWLYRRRKGKAGAFWWPWGVAIAVLMGGIASALRLTLSLSGF